jgi:transcription elongation GreA/GreB family factor
MDYNFQAYCHPQNFPLTVNVINKHKTISKENMKFVVKLFIISLLLIKFSSGFAQIDDDLLEDDTLNLKSNYIPELEAAKAEKRETRKARQKKNVIFGIKTKKSFIRKENSTQTILEQFRFMKAYAEPAPYLKDIVWYDKKNQKIVINPKKVDKSSFRLLHGPYYRTLNGKMTDTGFFYMGAKHGRWEKFGTNGHLLEKTVFHKGWLKHSKISYFDVAGTKIKEVIPVHHGKTTGDYFLFYENGQVATEGKYDHDIRIGKWTEYYPNKSRKKEIQYAANSFDETFQPVVLREWNEKGELLASADEKPVQNNQNMMVPQNEIPKKEEKISENQMVSENPEIKKEEPKKVIDKTKINVDAIVKLKDRGDGSIVRYKMVPDGEGDFKKKKISENSVIGKNLMGKKVGQIAKIKLEKGIRELEILEIEYPD